MLGPLQARIPLAANIASFPVLLPMLVTVSSVSSQREVAKPTCSAVISTWALTSSHFQRPATTLWPALAWRLSSPSFRQSVKTSARHPSSALSIQSRPQPGTRPRLSASAPLSTPASVRLPSAPLSRIERFPCPRPGSPSPETSQSLIKLIVRIDKIPQHIGIIGKASQPGLYGCLLEMFW